jgi:hypothetical protein
MLRPVQNNASAVRKTLPLEEAPGRVGTNTTNAKIAMDRLKVATPIARLGPLNEVSVSDR